MKAQFTTFLAAAFLASLAKADFYIGIISGEGFGSGAGTQTGYTTDYCSVGDQDVCDADGMAWDNVPDGSLDARRPNWCGTATCCGDGLIMDSSDDCGGSFIADDNIPDGTFYADVIDTNNNNEAVGRCVWELRSGKDCASTGSFLSSQALHCYTSVC